MTQTVRRADFDRVYPIRQVIHVGGEPRKPWWHHERSTWWHTAYLLFWTVLVIVAIQFASGKPLEIALP